MSVALPSTGQRMVRRHAAATRSRSRTSPSEAANRARLRGRTRAITDAERVAEGITSAAVPLPLPVLYSGRWAIEMWQEEYARRITLADTLRRRGLPGADRLTALAAEMSAYAAAQGVAL